MSCAGHLLERVSKSVGLCEFADGTCSFYREDSYTCTHNGGPYCGQWSKLAEARAKK